MLLLLPSLLQMLALLPPKKQMQKRTAKIQEQTETRSGRNAPRRRSLSAERAHNPAECKSCSNRSSNCRTAEKKRPFAPQKQKNQKEDRCNTDPPFQSIKVRSSKKGDERLDGSARVPPVVCRAHFICPVRDVHAAYLELQSVKNDVTVSDSRQAARTAHK